ncbi:MAG: 50S ribosomal protein L5 [Candidatus Chisholmbacteria bacterium]|nr:50S ribosomal protein L5 [Candidatus Chisholmbacteria bacterium]
MTLPRLQKKYEQEVKPKLKDQLGMSNLGAVPRLIKVVVSVGISEEQRQEALEGMGRQLALITGQKPVETRAKKSIAEFKIRAGEPVGLKVTLRGKRMYQFVDKLINVVLPQIKDFQGVAEDGFDGKGNYTLGLKEQVVFPELTYDTIDKIRGLEVTLVTSAVQDSQGQALLALLGVPFTKEVREVRGG